MKKIGSLRLWEIIGLVCLFLMLISLAIALTINFRPLYVWDISRLNILDQTDVSKNQLLDNYHLLLDFLNKPWVTELSLPDFPMSQAGAGHFYDVKKLFLLDYGILLLTIIPSWLFLRHLKNTKRFFKLYQPFQWGMILPIVFGVIMLMGFDRFFVTFHELFFTNDDWLFDPVTDPIINVLPETFFMHCFVLFFLLIEVFFLLFFLLGKRQVSTKKIASN